MAGPALRLATIARQAPRLALRIPASQRLLSSTAKPDLSKITLPNYLEIPIRKPPIQELAFSPFVPPLDQETAPQYDARLASQSKFSWHEIQSHPSNTELPVQHNIHEQDMYMATHTHNEKTHRYLVKGFPIAEVDLAKREVSAAYLGYYLGLGQYFPKIFGRQDSSDSLINLYRRFVRGTDTRNIIGNTQKAKEIPTDVVITLYVLHILFQENDIDNIRNAILTHDSEVVHDPVFTIDHERIFIGEKQMKLLQARGMERNWVTGDPIKGSHQWRETVSQEIGPDAFMEKLLSEKKVNGAPTLNPLLAILKEQGHTVESLKKLTVPKALLKRVLDSTRILNGVLLSNGIYDRTEIEGQTLGFHRTLRAWQTCVANDQDISVANLMTATYKAPEKTVFYPPSISVVTP